ncbi:MAG TPA: LuxR C-terminal-related transcriptional regulator, partial [Actinomycetota bacterium]|nr:LuxR C-terminal-related transcriptional regulator [Actinomycetota bacterium]
IDPFWTGIIYCDVIGACLELGDVRRAGEWSDAAKAWCETLTLEAPYNGMCRVNRAEVARLRGAWSEAEAEATLATEELAAFEPSVAASAYQQVGEIRRALGDLAGAEAAFERAQELGADPQPGLGLLRLAQRKIEAAMSALRLASSREQRPFRRARLLAAQVEAALTAGELDDARVAATELDAVATSIGMPAFDAIAATVGGAMALADGDIARSIESLLRATATWHELRLPYETARARALLGRALIAAGDDDGARIELRAALGTFERLGAMLDVEATVSLLEGSSALPGGLTAREVEVLRLVAEGKTNRDIAVELVISEHTVGRHLQNMYAKLGISTRAAATAYAFEHDLT